MNIFLQHILRAKGKWIWTRRWGLARKTLVRLMLYTSSLIHYACHSRRRQEDVRKWPNSEFSLVNLGSREQINEAESWKNVIKALPCHRLSPRYKYDAFLLTCSSARSPRWGSSLLEDGAAPAWCCRAPRTPCRRRDRAGAPSRSPWPPARPDTAPWPSPCQGQRWRCG